MYLSSQHVVVDLLIYIKPCHNIADGHYVYCEEEWCLTITGHTVRELKKEIVTSV